MSKLFAATVAEGIRRVIRNVRETEPMAWVAGTALVLLFAIFGALMGTALIEEYHRERTHETLLSNPDAECKLGYVFLKGTTVQLISHEGRGIHCVENEGEKE